jgi:hypothetical protein
VLRMKKVKKRVGFAMGMGVVLWPAGIKKMVGGIRGE